MRHSGFVKMKKPLVIYISPYDILRPRTNQISDVRFTEGFAQNDCSAHLIVPTVIRDNNLSKGEIKDAYGLTHHTHIHYLATRFKKDVHGVVPLLIIAVLSFFKTTGIIRKRKNNGPIYIISRSTHLLKPFLILKSLFPFLFRRTKIIHWAHDLHHLKKHTWTYKKSDFLLATNSSILQELIEISGKKPEQGCITLNPITEQQATEKISKEAAKKMIHLDSDQRPLIVYTGKLGIHYNHEVNHILDAASLLPEYKFLLTGGKHETVEYWKEHCTTKNLNNVFFTGYLHDYTKIRYYQYAADILISYYTHQGHDIRYNLPNKICEYMLTGNILITPDYPATRDLLNDRNCLFATPENSDALAERIRYAIEHPDECREKADRAARDVREFTFKKITGKLLEVFPK